MDVVMEAQAESISKPLPCGQWFMSDMMFCCVAAKRRFFSPAGACVGYRTIERAGALIQTGGFDYAEKTSALPHRA